MTMKEDGLKDNAALTGEEFEDLFSQVDKDSSGAISFEEYYAWDQESIGGGAVATEEKAAAHIRLGPIRRKGSALASTADGSQQAHHWLASEGKAPTKKQHMKVKACAKDIDIHHIRAVLRLDLPAEQRVETVFNMFDTDQSGFLDRDEVERLLLEMGFELLPDEFDKVMKAMDPSGDGQVELKELSAWITAHESTHARFSKQRSSRRAKLGCIAAFSAFCAAGCPCASSEGSTADNVAAGAFAAKLFQAICGCCCRQRFKKMFAPRGRWVSDPLFSTVYGGWYEILTYNGRLFGMWPLYKIILQVIIIIFVPASQALTQLMLLIGCELIAMIILYGNNCCGNPVHVNGGEHTVAVTGCWIQLAFLLVPMYAVLGSRQPNGSLMVYIAIIAIVVQLLVVLIKTALIAKALCTKKKKDVIGVEGQEDTAATKANIKLLPSTVPLS
jgi:Ca2+-binding EF-hand superfamily protein